MEPGGPRLASSLVPVPIERTERPGEVRESWYGWQTLPVDIATVVGLIYATANEDWELAAGMGALHLTAVPAMHLVHGETERAGASVGLRLGTAVGSGAAGALIGALISPLIIALSGGNADFFEIVGLTAVFSAGYGFVGLSPLVALLDGVALAWEPDEVEPSLEIVPAAGATAEGRPTFGIAGRF
jgi:hypothetical protein